VYGKIPTAPFENVYKAEKKFLEQFENVFVL